MATLTTRSIPTTTDDATFRAWGKIFSDALEAIGVTKTTDTGQIDWTTATRTASTDTMVGYEIRQFTDALQGTTPVFLKVEYGSGVSILRATVRITVGQGSNGTGSLTGNLSTTAYLGVVSAKTYLCDSFYSVNSGTFTLAWWVNGVYTDGASGYYIARTKDSSGVDTADGVNIGWLGSYSGIASGWQYLPASGVAYPATPLQTPMCACPPTLETLTYGLNGGVYPIHPNRGYPDNPDLGALAYANRVSSIPGAVVGISIYGVTHYFITLGLNSPGSSGSRLLNGVNTAGWSLMLRYE